MKAERMKIKSANPDDWYYDMIGQEVDIIELTTICAISTDGKRFSYYDLTYMDDRANNFWFMKK